GLEDRRAAFQASAHVGQLGAGGDADADHGDASDQRHSHDLEVGEAVCRIHRVVVHDTSPEFVPVSRPWPLKGSINSPSFRVVRLLNYYKDLDKRMHSHPTAVRHVAPLPFPLRLRAST